MTIPPSIANPHRLPLAALLLAAASSLAGAGLAAQQLAYDGFGNGPLANLNGSNGGAGWTSAWFDVGTDPTGIGAGLQYAGLATTPGGAVTPPSTSVWPATYYQRSFAAAPTGATDLYVSFLLRADAGYGSYAGITFGQYPYEMKVGVPLGMYTYGLMTSNGLGSLSGKPLVQGETTLVVLRISPGGGGGAGTWRMFLDPVIGAPEPAYPAAAYGLPAVSALPTALVLENGTGFTTDELRVGTAWAAVLPAGPSVWTDVGFAKPGVSGAPHLVGSGPFAPNTNNTLLLTQANPVANAWLVIGFVPVNAPFLGGVLVPDPILVSTSVTDAAGSLTTPLALPAFAPLGLPVLFQYWIEDPVATFGYAASNGLRGTVQ